MDLHDELQIDQALFGYSDGHRQIAASLTLPSRDMYELAARSDMEPGASISGDRSYVGGFTLAESRAFAVVKTWPAPEMPRPGCVWSHVLLLPRKFLATQVSLGVLEGLLKRPNGASDHRRYERKLVVRRLARPVPADPSIVAAIVASYYQDLPVILADTPDEAFERALFDVWSQQWPRLRSEFAFRTILTSAERPTSDLIIKVDFGGLEGRLARKAERHQRWIRAAVHDAISPKITPLRRFLWRYGKDLSRPKQSFKILVQLHLDVGVNEGGTSLETSMHVLRQFPGKTDALTLKRDLIGASSNALALMPRIAPADYAEVVVRWKVLEDGLASEPELRDIIAKFDQSTLFEIATGLPLSGGTPSREAEVMAETVIERLSEEALEQPGLPYGAVLLALRRRPELLAHFDAERIEASDAVGLLDLTDDRGGVAGLLRRVLTDRASDEAVTAVRNRVEAAFGQAVEMADAGRLHADWRKLFPRFADVVLKTGLDDCLEGVPLVARAIELLDFQLSPVLSAADWHRRAGRSPRDVTSDQTIVDAYLLVLCLREGVEKTMAILAEVLPRLRSQALADAFPARVKAFLDVNLPRRYEAWDFNKRLLKILRRAHRNDVDIFPALMRLGLNESELRYVLGNDEEATSLAVLAKLFWPFY